MICCENVVKILWTSLLFRQCHCHKSIPIIFFPSYFGNTIATNSFPQFFFPLFQQYYCHKPISTIFFPSYFGNAIATYSFPQFFPPLFQQCHCHKSIATFFFFFFEKWYIHTIFITFLQQIRSGRLLLVVIVGLKK